MDDGNSLSRSARLISSIENVDVAYLNTSFASMYPDGTLDYPSPDAEHLLPFGRVYVFTIEDFQRLTSAAANGRIDVLALLASCVEDDDTPAKMVMLFEQHLQRHKVLMEFSEPIEKAIDASSERLEKALSN